MAGWHVQQQSLSMPAILCGSLDWINLKLNSAIIDGLSTCQEMRDFYLQAAFGNQARYAPTGYEFDINSVSFTGDGKFVSESENYPLRETTCDLRINDTYMGAWIVSIDRFGTAVSTRSAISYAGPWTFGGENGIYDLHISAGILCSTVEANVTATIIDNVDEYMAEFIPICTPKPPTPPDPSYMYAPGGKFIDGNSLPNDVDKGNQLVNNRNSILANHTLPLNVLNYRSK